MATYKENKKTGTCLYCQKTVKPGKGLTWINRKGERRYKHPKCSLEGISAPAVQENAYSNVMCVCGHSFKRHTDGGNCCRVLISDNVLCPCTRFKFPLEIATVVQCVCGHTSALHRTDNGSCKGAGCGCPQFISLGAEAGKGIKDL